MKKIFKFFSILIMVCLLTGCMKMNVNVELKADKTATMEIEMLMEESMLKMADMTIDDLIEQIKSEMPESEEFKEFKTEPVTKTINDTKWVGVKLSGSGNAAEDIEEKEIDGVKSFVLTVPMDEMENQMDMSELDAYGYSVEKLKALGMEMKITIKMPGKVTSSYGTVQDDTVIIDLLDLMANGKTDDIVISSPIENDSSMTPVIIGVLVVAVLVIVFVVLKKKKNPAKENDVVEENAGVEETANDESEIKTE